MGRDSAVLARFVFCSDGICSAVWRSFLELALQHESLRVYTRLCRAKADPDGVGPCTVLQVCGNNDALELTKTVTATTPSIHMRQIQGDCENDKFSPAGLSTSFIARFGAIVHIRVGCGGYVSTGGRCSDKSNFLTTVCCAGTYDLRLCSSLRAFARRVSSPCMWYFENRFIWFHHAARGCYGGFGLTQDSVFVVVWRCVWPSM